MNSMTIARKQIVDDQTAGFYHCTNRCVRRTFLCGIDKLTGKDFSHRKDWLENRMLELTTIFSVDIYAYTVMENHYHIVLYSAPLEPLSWTDEQVAKRWLLAYPGRLNLAENAKLREMKKQAIMADVGKLKTYRKRLGSLSWFMGRSNEPIAKQSNGEDYCTGKFWEGRYSAQALLDETAVFSCMAYVDLNPARAKITEKLDESNNTSIKKRLNNIQNTLNKNELNENIEAIAGQIKQRNLLMPLKDYIELVEWTGKSIIHPNRASIPAHITPILQRLNLQRNHWLHQIENYSTNYCHVVGSVEKIREKAAQLKRRCFHGITAAKLLYEKRI